MRDGEGPSLKKGRKIRLFVCTLLVLLAAGVLVVQLTHRQHQVLCMRNMGRLRLLFNPPEMFGETILTLDHRPVFAVHLGPTTADFEVYQLADIGQRTLIPRRSTSFDVGTNFFGKDSFGLAMTGTFFQIPFWFVHLLLLSYPTLLLLRCTLLWMRGRTLPNPCINCGYNLTGNVTGTCPECGKEMA